MSDPISDLLVQAEAKAAQASPIDVCIGMHWTLVTVSLAGVTCAGLASTLGNGGEGHARRAGAPVARAGKLLDLPVQDLAALARSDSSLEVSVGLATLNALLEVDTSLCLELNAADLLLERGAGRRVAVVGHFPFVSQLRAVAATLCVLELDPGPGDRPATEAPQWLPQADVIALTGSSLLNRTFGALIGLCRQDAFVVMLGATTPLSPIFFRYGVDAVSGTQVTDIKGARAAVSQGATYRQIPGRRQLTMLAP
jgi:uncharacterized protein